ncbi:hypothetical protein [Marilutibacter maris]|uniref:Uncharacterized protein n=1 Tax=Marilutibacter maris TaxID=1605891 RepID=A0A508AMR5_9GAMM|nr:hypothetical protein [Lysobacter maris]KAB8181304.1 hypothetical protein FKV24_011685 [Lysobacter maris]
MLEFSERYLKRALTEAERETLDSLVASGMSIAPPDPGDTDPVRLVVDAVKSGQQTIDETLSRVREEAANHLARAGAGADSETHALLQVLEKAEDLGALRPSRLQPGQASSNSHVLMTQIADRLANLVKKEVESLFQSRFGALAQQLEQALAALPGASAEPVQATPETPAAEPVPEPAPQAGKSSAKGRKGGSGTGRGS